MLFGVFSDIVCCYVGAFCLTMSCYIDNRNYIRYVYYTVHSIL